MIYFIKYGEDRVKIGYTSRNVEKRLYELQQEAPNMSLKILETIEGDKKKEAELHDKFRSICVGNEYFKYSDEIISFISNLEKIEYCGFSLTKKEYAYINNILIPGHFNFYINMFGLSQKESPQIYFKDTGEELNILEKSYFEDFKKWAIEIEYFRDKIGRVITITDGYRHGILYRDKKGGKLIAIPATISLCGSCGNYYFRECFNDWSCNKCMRGGDSFSDPYGEPLGSPEENYFIDCYTDIRCATAFKDKREEEIGKIAMDRALMRINEKQNIIPS